VNGRSWLTEAQARRTLPTVTPAPWLAGAMASAALLGVLGRLRRARRAAVAQALVALAAELAVADSEDAVANARVRGEQRLLRDGRRAVTAADYSTVDILAESAMRRVTSTARSWPKEGALDALVEQASDVILVVDAADRIRYASPSARSLFATSTLADVPMLDLIDPPDRRLAQYLLRHARRAGSAAAEGGRADLTTRGVNGHRAQVEATCRDLRSDDSVGGIVVTLRDVTGQRRLERELTEQASRDALTGLPNRLWFADRVNRALLAQVGVTGVLLVDLDHFRDVNEGLGRPTGDKVLIGVGQRLQAAAGPGNVVARLGEDEFGVLVSGAGSVRQVTDLATQVLKAMRRPLTIDGRLLSCLASMGVATAIGASTEEELLRHADLALDAAKAGGRDRWHHYTSSMAHAVRIRREMRSHLMRTLDEGTLIVEYQPIVNLATSLPVGFEALVRCPHPTRGILSPVEFIDIAEESGIIVPLGEHVLAEAAKTARSWASAGADPTYVSVNVSVRQFRSSGFVDTVAATLARASLPPERLVLEITESLLLRDDDAVWEDLKRLRDMGIRVAIDDFGTGYSALSYLRQVPLDIVKLDRMFVTTMTTSRRQRDLVHGIVGLIDLLRLEVVAEGIETAEHRRACAEVGCRFGQGYLFARPMPAADTLDWVRSKTRAAPRPDPSSP
jgi:diguanylate cyclase (GGDEF)-like protein/PAS domain S-box-containing protein